MDLNQYVITLRQQGNYFFCPFPFITTAINVAKAIINVSASNIDISLTSYERVTSFHQDGQPYPVLPIHIYFIIFSHYLQH
jgi:hypothetical protein